MLNNFIYAKQKSLFEEKLNAGEVLDEAIVFIEDTKEIWNHGTYFNSSFLTEDEGEIGEIDDEVYVKYVAQNLTSDQQYQARLNIGAVSADYVDNLIIKALNTAV